MREISAQFGKNRSSEKRNHEEEIQAIESTCFQLGRSAWRNGWLWQQR
jgi:hypothetical protein